MTKVQLTTGAELRLEVAVDELIEAIESAMKKNGLVELDGGDGRMVVLNPQHVLYFSNGEPDPVRDGEGEQVPVLDAAG